MRLLIFYCVIFLSPFSIFCQEVYNVDILNAKEAIMETRDIEKVKILTGDVKLKHKGTLIYCDSATIFENNNIEAIGNVLITRPSGTKIHGKYLNYFSQLRLAVVKENVVLTDKKSKLYTTDITYDMNHDIGYYLNGGKLVNEKTIITSLHGTYYSKTSLVLFKQNVIVESPKYKLTSDSLQYNTKLKRTFFTTSTKIENDSGYIWCNKGWYDEEKNEYSFGKGTIIYNSPQMILTDSIYFNKNTGFSRIYKTFEFHDTSSKIHVYGDTAEMWDNNKHIKAYKRPILIYESSDNKPLFVRANTLESKEDKLKNKTFYGYKNVRIYSQDFQAVCDTFTYFSLDSIMRLYKDPFAWKDSSQISGKKLNVLLRNNKPNKIEIYENGLIAKEEAKDHYSQIAGDTIFINLNDGKIQNVISYFNAKSIYYAKEDGKGYLGINSSECYKLVASFDSGNIKKIAFYEKPKSIFYPLKDINTTNKFLSNFVWKVALRPKSKDDL